MSSARTERCCTSPIHLQRCRPQSFTRVSAQPVLGAQTVSQGQHHACAISADQSVWCWPTDTTANAVGQLGNGTTDASGPIFRASQVLTGPNAPLTKAASLSGVSSRWATNTCAVTTEGKLYCWGDLSYTAGGGTTTKSPYASVITSNGLTAFSSVLQVSADYANACAVVQGTTSKELWCWGANNYGQLGTGDTKAQQYPVKYWGSPIHRGSWYRTTVTAHLLAPWTAPRCAAGVATIPGSSVSARR